MDESLLSFPFPDTVLHSQKDIEMCCLVSSEAVLEALNLG